MDSLRRFLAKLARQRGPAPFNVRRIVVSCDAGTLVDITPDMLRYYLALADGVGPDKLARLESDGILSVYLGGPEPLRNLGVSLGFIDRTDPVSDGVKNAPSLQFKPPPTTDPTT